MRIVLAAVGRMKAGPERDLLARYLGRAEGSARSAGLGAVTTLEVEESRARSADQRKRDEWGALSERLPAHAGLIVLDEGGANWGSAAIAAEVGRQRDSALPALVFAIGGPDGWDPAALGHRRLAFGAATFPHQLVRVLVAEQIYRAITILTGHPYHRA